MKKVSVNLSTTRLVLILSLATALALAMGGTGARDYAEADGGKSGVVQPVLVPSIKSGTSPPLRDLAVSQAASHRPSSAGHGSGPPHGGRGDAGKKKHPVPRRLGQAGPSEMSTPDLSFNGATQADNISLIDRTPEVPDASLAVGPNHLVQMTNLAFTVFDKSGNVLTGPVLSGSIWSGVGSPCAADYGAGDQTNAPTVLYDHLADRWLLSQFASFGTFPAFLQGPFYECIAVSQTADPSGAYNVYVFTIGGDSGCDSAPYCARNGDPRLGLWPDGYYLASPQLRWDGATLVPAGQGVAVFNRSEMLSGAPTVQKVYFDLASLDTPLQPSDLDGPAPSAGTPNYFMGILDGAFTSTADSLKVYEFHVDWTTPANSTFGSAGMGPNLIIDTSSSSPLAPFAGFDPATYSTAPCASGLPCIPQPNTTTELGPLAHRIMSPVQYRDFGSHRTMIANHTVDGGGTGRAGIRWYELRDSGSGWSIFQQGTYAPSDGESRWVGSAAINGNGDIAVGFNVSSPSIFPALRYAGRQATDPPGLLSQGEGQMVAGSGARVNSSSEHLWGDYSTLVVDPSDDRTFWYTGEYHEFTADDDWSTRIGSFKVPPDTFITSGPTGNTTDTNATFSFSSNVSSSTFECELDGGGFAPCTSPHTYNSLGDGAHTFRVRAVGSVDATPASRAWTVASGQTGATVATQGSTTVATGSTFTVDIVVDSSTALDIGVAQVYLDFNQTYLQVVDSGDPSGPLVPGPVFGGAWEDVIQNSADNVAGQVSFAGGKGITGADVQTPFVLAQVQFQAIAPTPAGVGTDLTFNMGVPRRTRVVSGINDVTSTVAGATVHVADSAAPVASDDGYSVPEGTVLNVGAASGLLSNDTHPDGDPLTAVLVSGPSNGSLTLNSDGSFTYTSNPGFTGVDTFTYQASDGVSSSNQATVTITVLLEAPFTANLQGRPLPPDSSWVLGFTVDLYAPGADPLTDAPQYSYNVATDLSGSLVVDVTPGIYDLRVKGDNTLRVLLSSVDLTSSPPSAIDLGTQMGGDSSKDNTVDSDDYSEVLAAFGKLVSNVPGNLAGTDHNGDGIVDIADYGMVVSNFGSVGAAPAG